MDVDAQVSYDEVDRTRLRAEKIELNVDTSPEPQALRLFHMMSPVQKLQLWLMTLLSIITIVAQLLSVVGQATIYIELHTNKSSIYK